MEECNELCNILKLLNIKAIETFVNMNSIAIAFQRLFAADNNFSDNKYIDIVNNNWFDIGNQLEVENAVSDDEIEILKNEKSPADDPHENTLEQEDPMKIDDDDEVYYFFRNRRGNEKAYSQWPKF